MLFAYKGFDKNNQEIQGTIDALSLESAINTVQQRGFVISSIDPIASKSFLERAFSLGGGVKVKDVVLLSRQMATLFEAQVSALRVFRLLGGEATSPALRDTLVEVADDLQAGSSISKALAKHPKVFSKFYVSMVRAGEESGKLDSTFLYLADYLERNYELSSKAKNALVYPAFVIFVFISVMVLMMTVVIPKLSAIIKESGQPMPIYTEVVIWLSDFFVHYGVFLAVGLVVGGVFLWRWALTDGGKAAFDKVKLGIPYLGTLYSKLYLSRIADNLSTMLLSAIPIVKALEITGEVVGSRIYQNILKDATDGVKAGNAVSDTIGKYKEVPSIMVQMMKVGEETGELDNILKTLARFYSREVVSAVDTLVGLIEPAMVVALGLGVGFLLAAILIPIYNISMSQ